MTQGDRSCVVRVSTQRVLGMLRARPVGSSEERGSTAVEYAMLVVLGLRLHGLLCGAVDAPNLHAVVGSRS